MDRPSLGWGIKKPRIERGHSVGYVGWGQMDGVIVFSFVVLWIDFLVEVFWAEGEVMLTDMNNHFFIVIGFFEFTQGSAELTNYDLS